jgi:hypothetical protein
LEGSGKFWKVRKFSRSLAGKQEFLEGSGVLQEFIQESRSLSMQEFYNT